jgi:hypothetical protein
MHVSFMTERAAGEARKYLAEVTEAGLGYRLDE